MNCALIHDWLIGMRGGEKVLEEICGLFPGSDIYTLFYVPENISPFIRNHTINQSFLQKIPGALKKYRYFLPLFPLAVRSFHLSNVDAVISISHCVAKGIRVSPDIPHFCYCLTPMRYIWDNYDAYFASSHSPLPIRASMKLVRPYLKRWDVASSRRVDYFISISKFVARRIKDYYGRDSEVIHPPVNTAFFISDSSIPRDEYYLIVSALVPYKKIDIAVLTFNKLTNKKLKIVGVGPEYNRLIRLRNHNNIEFIGRISDERLRSLYQGAKALIHCGEEDFGIAMVEAQACGTPVIAFNRGGAAEIVNDGVTGILFSEQSTESLTNAIDSVNNKTFDYANLRKQALRFSGEMFRQKFYQYIMSRLGRGTTT